MNVKYIFLLNTSQFFITYMPNKNYRIICISFLFFYRIKIGALNIIFVPGSTAGKTLLPPCVPFRNIPHRARNPWRRH